LKKTLLTLLFTTISLSSLAKGSKFNIATFNIKWFGLGGEISGTAKDEFRQPWIKEYLRANHTQTKAIVFQEIVNVNLLKEMMSEFDMSCESYESSKKNHQHVAICLDNDYELLKEKGESDYVLEEVDTSNGMLRPAVYGIVSHRKTRKKLFHLIAVHLKANTLSTDTRLNQVEVIKNKVKEIGGRIPFVIIGDFNSYTAQATGRDKGDVELISDILSQSNLSHVEHTFEYTFRTNKTRLLLDHAWVSNDLEYENVEVGKSCNYFSRYATRFDSSPFFNRFVSDHCPLSFNLKLK
jgi:endonuclease/exonuclease/phosphatase family metal-dependent hydrolase